MKFEIKSRWSGAVLFSIETENWKLAVEAGVKAKADLRWANLGEANLRVAFSCLTEAQIPVVFDAIARAVRDHTGR